MAIPDECKSNVGKTMPFALSPSHHHFYRWYVETIPSHGWFMALFYPHLLIPKRLCNFSLPMALRTVPSQDGHVRAIPTKSHGPGIIIINPPDIPSGYD